MTLGRVRDYVATGVTTVLGLSLLAGILLPVYTDEVGWRFQERAAIDGFDKMFSDGCGANTLAVPPFFMLPVRHFSALLNQLFADPLFVRLSGVGYALLLVWLIGRLLQRIARDPSERAVLRIIALGLLALGLMPLLLVWSRPEQPLILSLVGALLIASAGWPTAAQASNRQIALRCLGIVALAVIALSYHFKAVLLAPIFGLCLLTCSRWKSGLTIRLSAAIALSVLSVVAARYWFARFDCPDDPILSAVYTAQNLVVRSVDGETLVRIANRLFGGAGVTKYFTLVAPAEYEMSSWLVDHAVTQHQSQIWRGWLTAAWSLSIILCLCCQGRAIFLGVQRRSLDARLLLSVAILGAYGAWSATLTVKNVYDASFVLPLLVLSIALAVAAAELPPRLLKWLTFPVFALGLGALVSPLLVGRIYLPPLWQAAHHRGYLPQQKFSQPVFGYRSEAKDIRAAARLCRIGVDSRPRGLMVDDVTYFAFMNSYRPQHYLGVTGRWRGKITDPVAYLKSVGSDGAVLDCRRLTPGLARRAPRAGNYCCLGPPNW